MVLFASLLNAVELQAQLDLSQRRLKETTDHISHVCDMLEERLQLKLDSPETEALLSKLLDQRVVLERRVAELRTLQPKA